MTRHAILKIRIWTRICKHFKFLQEGVKREEKKKDKADEKEKRTRKGEKGKFKLMLSYFHVFFHKSNLSKFIHVKLPSDSWIVLFIRKKYRCKLELFFPVFGRYRLKFFLNFSKPSIRTFFYSGNCNQSNWKGSQAF